MLREEVSRGLNSRRFFVVLLLCLIFLSGKSYADEPYTITHTHDFYLIPYDVGCPGGEHSGGGTSILNIYENLQRAVITEVHLDDNGYVLVNGIKIYEDLGACCSASAHYVTLNITNLVHTGDNSVYGYADDCCGYCALVKVRFNIDYLVLDAFPEMDDKWDTLSPANKAAKVTNGYEFNKFSATYATLTSNQVAGLITNAKAAYPDYAYIDTNLVKGLISVESSNNYLAMSDAGALGLGQIIYNGAESAVDIPAWVAFEQLQGSLDLPTFKYGNLAVDNRAWPARNVAMILHHIDFLNKHSFINNDVDKMLASYNWGQKKLRDILKIRPDDWFLTGDFPDNVRDYVIQSQKSGWHKIRRS